MVEYAAMKTKPAMAALAAAVLLAGCIGAGPKAPCNWTLDWERSAMPHAAAADAAAPIVRISSVTVRPPYDLQRLAVLRKDGSLAFDPRNSFAASPAQLMRGAVHDAFAASGRFKRVLSGSSAAAASLSAEVSVTLLALDCRRDGQRDATVELSLVFVEDREVVYSSRGKGIAATPDGDYSAAFSRAFALAVQDALRGN